MSVRMKEEDIRKYETFVQYLELVQKDAETIFGDRSSFQDLPCPACGESNASLVFEKIGFRYVQCPRCDTLYVNPRPALPHLLKIYEDSPSTRYWVEEFFRPMIEPRRERIFRPRAEYISSRFPELRGKIIADIGAGFGLFLEELQNVWPGTKLTAIEPSIDMAKICEENGFTVIQSMLEDIDPQQHSFDLLTAFELFEHLHSPGAFVKKVFDLLSPGGYFFLTTLNGLGFDIQVLWEKSQSVSPPHHLNFFNPRSISALFESHGFEVIEASTPGQLDWDILESAVKKGGTAPGRFFETLMKYADDKAKEDLQVWIRDHGFSSHMRLIARKKE